MSNKVNTIKRLVSLGFSAEEALAMAGANDPIMGMAIDTPAIPSTPDPVPTQETKDDWSIGNYKFGAVSVTLLEKKDDTHFKALIFPVGMRQDHSIQPSKLSVKLLNAMKRSFTAVSDDSPTTCSPKTEKKPKISKDEKAQNALTAYLADNPDVKPAYIGWRNKGVSNCFVWEVDGSGYLLHRIGFSGDKYNAKGKQPVNLSHPGSWASRKDGRYTIKGYTI